MITISSLIKYGLIYPVHLLRREWVPLYRGHVGRLDYLPANDLKAYQSCKINSLLNACSHDAYYQIILSQLNWAKGQRWGCEELSQLPFLTKEIIRREEAKRKHHLLQGLDHRSTSGSTGTPFAFWKDRQATGYMQAVQDHANSWHGLGVGEPQGRFWGLPLGRAGQVARLKDRLKNRIRFSAFDLTDQAKNAFYQQLKGARPTYFYGYPSLMLEFARFLEAEKLSLAQVPIKVAIGTGEHVYPHEREELQRLLGVPFVGEYGCTETGVIGVDCPHGRMHLMASNIVLEVVDEAGCSVPTGIEGEIIVSELNARYFPFIRYRLGDRGRLTGETCPCGRTLPVFEVLSGRKDDYIVTPEGKRVYDAILAYTLKKGVAQFKAVQDRLDHICIFVRSDGQLTLELQSQYVEQLQKAISQNIVIEIFIVEEIERSKSGKMRYFRSDINKEII